MTDYMSQMLNELMGPQRNSLPGEEPDMDFDHPDVCRDFLVGFCIYESFRNTKNDMGYCPAKIHDEAMRIRYRQNKRCGRLGYEEKFNDKCRRLYTEVRRKIEKNETRLSVTQNEDRFAHDPVEKQRNVIKEKRIEFTRRIEEKMREAEIEGAKGNVEAAKNAVKVADGLTRDRDALNLQEVKLDEEVQRMMMIEEQFSSGNKQMQVCSVCGCFMLTNDAQSRIDDHLSGKLHVAYKKIKEYLDKVDREKEEKRKQYEEERAKERKEKEGEEKKDKDGDEKKDRKKDDERDREGDRKKDDDRDRKKDDDRDRKKDNDRDRKKDDDRDRKKDDDRDRKRDDDRDRKDRDRRDRDRDRERDRKSHRRSRSRDRSDRDRRDHRDRKDDRDRRDRDRRDRSSSRERRRR